MSVTENLQLPGQPTDGGAYTTPLGGNGLTAPIHRTDVKMILTGDASGGSLRHRIYLDKRHAHIINWITVEADPVAADTEFIVNLELREGVNRVELVDAQHFALGGVAYGVFTPPSIFVQAGVDTTNVNTPPFIQITTANVNAMESRVKMQILAFDIEAVRRVPYWQLMNNKPF